MYDIQLSENKTCICVKAANCVENLWMAAAVLGSRVLGVSTGYMHQFHPKPATFCGCASLMGVTFPQAPAGDFIRCTGASGTALQACREVPFRAGPVPHA